MTIQYPIKLSVVLDPIHHTGPIVVNVGINDNLTTINLQNKTTINFEFATPENCALTVELPTKQDQEAVIIDRVSFFDIEDPKFAWAGIYKPKYPEPWAGQQRSQGVVLKPQLHAHTYLGWPGKWTLTFTVPVFTWIHQTQDLGWIYS
jgi:hypothetical protein